MFDNTLQRLLENSLLIPGAILGYVVHELAHALVAYWQGDRGAVARTRFTLNPLRHIPLIGLPLFLVFGFAWAKPLRLNTAAFRRPHRAVFFTALAGSLANLALGLGLYAASLLSLALALLALPQDALRGPIFRFYFGGGTPPVLSALVAILTFRAAQANLALALVNLVPLPPFDGFWALYAVWRGLRRGRQAAVPAATPAPADAPGSVDALFREGALLQAGRKWAQAAETYQRVLALDPRERRAAYALGQVYERLGNRSDAARAYGRAYVLSQDEEERRQAAARLEELHVALADALAALPGPAEPQPQRTRGAAGAPEARPLRFRWQWAAVAAGTVLVLLALYVGVFPGAAVRSTGADAFLERLGAAQAAFAAQDAASGEAALRTALDLAGGVYAQPADRDARARAAAGITAIAAEAPASPSAAALRALVELDAGNAGEALRRLQAIPDQNDFFPQFYMASAYVETGQWAAAQRALLAAVAVRPNDAAAHNNLAFVYLQLGQYDQAQVEAERALTLDPSMGHGWKNRSLVYLADAGGGAEDLAYGAAVIATFYAPGLASAHEALGRALLANGQPEWAAEELREAERLRDMPYSPYY